VSLLDDMRAQAHADSAFLVDELYALLTFGRSHINPAFAKIGGAKALTDGQACLALTNDSAALEAKAKEIIASTNAMVAEGRLAAQRAWSAQQTAAGPENEKSTPVGLNETPEAAQAAAPESNPL
jgi:hypothetical protein